jgi:hypothetical protein
MEDVLDIVDETLISLASEYVSDDDDDFELFTSELFILIAEMVAEGEIEEVPEDDADEDLKRSWIEQSIPKIKERLNGDKSSSD